MSSQAGLLNKVEMMGRGCQAQCENRALCVPGPEVTPWVSCQLPPLSSLSAPRALLGTHALLSPVCYHPPSPAGCCVV